MPLTHPEGSNEATVKNAVSSQRVFFNVTVSVASIFLGIASLFYGGLALLGVGYGNHSAWVSALLLALTFVAAPFFMIYGLKSIKEKDLPKKGPDLARATVIAATLMWALLGSGAFGHLTDFLFSRDAVSWKTDSLSGIAYPSDWTLSNRALTHGPGGEITLLPPSQKGAAPDDVITAHPPKVTGCAQLPETTMCEQISDDRGAPVFISTKSDSPYIQKMFDAVIGIQNVISAVKHR